MPSPAITRHADEPAGWSDLARAIGTFYHDPRWIREIATCFGYRVHWLAAGAGGAMAGGLAKLKELLVFFEWERLARELGGANAFVCRFETFQKLEHRAVTSRRRIESA